jgi:hypothetical protein
LYECGDAEEEVVIFFFTRDAQNGAAWRLEFWKAYAGLLENLGGGCGKSRGELADLKSDSSEA